MADTNRVGVAVVEEATYGVTPASPAFRDLRVTSANVSQTPTSTQSREIRSDRQRTDTILTGTQAGGDLGTEMSFGNLDALLKGLMSNAWTEMPTVAPTAITGSALTVTAPEALLIKRGMVLRGTGYAVSANNGLIVASADGASTSVTVSGSAIEASPPGGARMKVVGFQCASGDCAADGPAKTLTISATSGTWTSLGLVPGDWIKIGGSAAANQFATAASNGWARVALVTPTVLTLDVVPAGFATDTGAAKTIRITLTDRIRNGTTLMSYTIERRFEDIPEYEYFRGMMVGSGNFRARAQSIIEATVSFQGRDGTIGGTRLSGATTVAAATGDVLNTGDNMGRIGMGGAPVDGPNYVTEATISISNNIRGKPAVGHRGFVGNSLGEFAVEGVLETYFGNRSLYEAMLNNTASSFDMRVQDGALAGYVFDLPRIKFKSGTPQVPGTNQDVLLPLGFDASKHPTLGYTLHIARFSETL